MAKAGICAPFPMAYLAATIRLLVNVRYLLLSQRRQKRFSPFSLFIIIQLLSYHCIARSLLDSLLAILHPFRDSIGYRRDTLQENGIILCCSARHTRSIKGFHDAAHAHLTIVASLSDASIHVACSLEQIELRVSRARGSVQDGLSLANR